MNDRGKLGNFLTDVIDWRWDEFCAAELDINYNSFEASVFSLVRVAAEGKLGAIKLAIDRVDGKIETPVNIEYPKVWLLFPDAKKIASKSQANREDEMLQLPDPEVSVTDITIAAEEQAEEAETKSPATLSLRETLNKMADKPRSLTRLIQQRKVEVEAMVKANGGMELDEAEAKTSPRVKSIIAANLLLLAEGGKFEAITEVFDQIDGKLVETIKILGSDIFLSSYLLEAPQGAVKNKDGVYMIEAAGITEQWKQRLNPN